MKSSYSITLFLIFSTLRLSASLDTCYQVVEVVDGVDFEVLMTVTLDFDQGTFYANESGFALIDSTSYQTGNRLSLIDHFDCIYLFDRFEDTGIFEASKFTVESLGLVLFVTHHQADFAYMITDYGIYIVVACPDESECISPRYKQAELANVDFTLTAIPDGSEFTISPPEFELVTEQVLVQDDYNILTVVEHEFELVTEQRAKTFTNICPDYDAVYAEVNEEVLVQESYSVLTVIPAQFELVLEEVLASEAHTDVEIVSVSDWSQPYSFESTPEYLRFIWESDQNCLSHHAYDCVEIFTEQVPRQLYSVSEPSTWNCDTQSDWSDDVLLISQIDATYRTRSYFKLKVPAMTEAQTVPAETKIRTFTTIENMNEIPDTCIQITYEIDTIQRLAVPTTALSQTVPAQYKTRQYLKLVENGQYSFELPQLSCNIQFTGQRIVNPSSITYDGYVCEITDIQRQEAIKLSLYEAGDLDALSTPYSSGLFWESLFDFQSYSDDWDIGPLNEAQAQFLDRP